MATLGDGEVPLSIVISTGLSTVILASALAYLLVLKNQKNSSADEDANGDNTQTVETVLDRTKYPAGNLYIYYGTQTGTAEQFGKQLEREANGFYVHVIDLEDVTSLQQLQSPAVFLSATYGEGEPPDNAFSFVEMLKGAAGIPILFSNEDAAEEEKTASEEDLQHLESLQYCVFGLGNKQYDHYNAMGKFLFEGLKRAGAQPLLPEPGLGDDDDDLEGDFETWKDNKLWPTLKQHFGSAENGDPVKKEEEAMPESPYVVEYHKQPAAKLQLKSVKMDQVHGGSRQYFDAVDCTISKVKELQNNSNNDNNGSTVHVELQITDRALSYQTADNLGVLPVNSAEIAEQVARCLGYDLNAVFSVKAAPNHEWHGLPFPMPCSIRDFLTLFCDLTAAPRRSELKLLAAFCQDAVDKKFLQRLSAKENKDEYREKILDNYMGIANLLVKCPSLKVPLEQFVDLCPRLQPRFFTIASSSSVSPKCIHLTVAVAKAERPMDKTMFHGVCSTYLATRDEKKKRSSSSDASSLIPQSHMVRAFVRPSSFRLPSDASTPILMIGPGTGVAPMRALLQERRYMKKNQRNKQVGANILYFGCKKRSWDYLYQDEFEQLKSDGTLTALHLAFSREQEKKVYVQHLLAQNAEETFDLMEKQGAYIYVCGGVKMGQDVQEALKQIIVSKKNVNDKQAKDCLDLMAKEGRYVQELWA